MSFDPASLQAGDCVLVAGGGGSLPARVLDALIRWSTGSRYTHCAIAVGPGRIVEALWHVTEDSADKYAKVGDVYRVAVTEEQKAKAVAFARKRIGRTYGIREILLDGARLDLHWLPRQRRPLRHFTCSGLLAAAYAAGGVLLTRAPWPSPGDLANSPLLTEVA